MITGVVVVEVEEVFKRKNSRFEIRNKDSLNEVLTSKISIGFIAEISSLLEQERVSVETDKQRKKLKLFDLETLSDTQCKEEFKFSLSEIMCEAMELPIILHLCCSKRHVVHVSREFAFAIILYQFAFSWKYCSMKREWGMNAKDLGFIKFKNRLEFDTRQFSAENCEHFAKAIYERTKTYLSVIGFIDGTMQKLYCPKSEEEQKTLYNRWKHIHCIKYQDIATPDHITSSLIGPFVGSTHNANFFDETKTLDHLILYFTAVSRDKYPPFVFKPFPLDETLKDNQKARINYAMSIAQVQVEMEFGKVGQYFKYCKFSSEMKIKLKALSATIYILSTLFKNFHTCINGSATSAMFDIQPPNIQDYIRGLVCDPILEDTVDTVDTILYNAPRLVESIPLDT
ncbi:hypothetical protein PHYBLDRAFT_63042 [Phycomyces blakesleeanus NRRL 1555(-)]|uniref:DDE Tnp4 domain-containing protein n=1 Tax=Phycomyces blakesleeanus (strain ATCC 8743b / DSM 1359 / FGSC 10004 / NBRC 33097 / NRRL 1555) TaxID=763407 RepID=A0A162XVV6_PHYB8|nr:hypothetical protein PHYBLDRAFT_63042 [Phycomyces blakesleeanus NRRL 1555(-)]OAD76755.1 hypothetical protein PHYBLDRAFT_63042 [Phycomyces blakesleeanus NRRL 1555(-)]|eukprot:XP_018294795.1 hypothetical protein PHYBLDRAFT_63042 [Phycomyces blakesleeanus NRRL 1555(-)]